MIGLRHLMILHGAKARRLAGSRAKAGFTLGPVTVDPVGRRISRAGATTAVEPRIMELLLYLSRRPGQTVSKQELIERVWRAHVVDDAVHRAVSLLRSALGDCATSPAIIETVPRRGYRLLVRPTGARRRLLLPATAMIVLALAGIALFQPGISPQRPAMTNPESVRPIANGEPTARSALTVPEDPPTPPARMRLRTEKRPVRTAVTETPVPTAVPEPTIETPAAAPLPPAPRPTAIGSAAAQQPAPLAPYMIERPQPSGERR